MGRRSNKREQLVFAARDVIYEQGYANTTLADIASQAEVPLGNVYYYFKTKESLVDAVLADRLARLEANFAEATEAGQGEPLKAIRAYFERALTRKALTSRLGCPYGSLAQELGKQRPDELRGRGRPLLARQLDWVTQLLSARFAPERARELALEIISRAQGACLLAHALSDPDALDSCFQALFRRLDELEAA